MISFHVLVVCCTLYRYVFCNFYFRCFYPLVPIYVFYSIPNQIWTTRVIILQFKSMNRVNYNLVYFFQYVFLFWTFCSCTICSDFILFLLVLLIILFLLSNRIRRSEIFPTVIITKSYIIIKTQWFSPVHLWNVHRHTQGLLNLHVTRKLIQKI